MPIEIERKFLITNDRWRALAHEVVPMAQGYINDQAAMGDGLDGGGVQRASVRVRIAGDTGHLNLKSFQPGHTRQEFDYPIPLSDARALLTLCVGGIIDKRRHYVRHGGHLWEVDEFLGENAGLLVAEVELGHADEAVDMPSWIGTEVTDALRYYNLALAARPYSQWSDGEQAATDLTGDTPCS